MERKGTLASEAVARASSVFSVPGGPYSRAPCGRGKAFSDTLSWEMSPCSGSGQYTHLGYSATEFRVSARMPEVVDKLHHLILCLLHASHVSEAAQIQQSAPMVANSYSGVHRVDPTHSLGYKVKLGHHSWHRGKAISWLFTGYSILTVQLVSRPSHPSICR